MMKTCKLRNRNVASGVVKRQLTTFKQPKTPSPPERKKKNPLWIGIALVFVDLFRAHFTHLLMIFIYSLCPRVCLILSAIFIVQHGKQIFVELIFFLFLFIAMENWLIETIFSPLARHKSHSSQYNRIYYGLATYYSVDNDVPSWCFRHFLFQPGMATQSGFIFSFRAFLLYNRNGSFQFLGQLFINSNNSSATQIPFNLI